MLVPRLVELAQAQGFTDQPEWSLVRGYLLDLEKGVLTPGEFRTVLRIRPGRASFKKPAFLCEKLKNLNGGGVREPNRQAELELLQQYEAALPGHPLLTGAMKWMQKREMLQIPIVQGKKKAAAIPGEEWIVFAHQGKTAEDYPEIRTFIEKDAALQVGEYTRICASCSKRCKPVIVHDGIVEIGGNNPKWMTWDTRCTYWGSHSDKWDNLPICAGCSRLSTKMLNELVRRGQWVGQDAVIELDGVYYVIQTQNACAWIEQKVPVTQPRKTTGRATLAAEGHLEFLVGLVPTIQGRLLEKDARSIAMKQLDTIAAEAREVPPHWKNPAWQAGYQFGIFEQVLLSTNSPLVRIQEATEAPNMVLPRMLFQAHAAIAALSRPKEPTKEEDKKKKAKKSSPRMLRKWFEEALVEIYPPGGTGPGVMLPSRLLPSEHAMFALGYVHSLEQRQGVRCDSEYHIGRLTPPQLRLCDALQRAGIPRYPADVNGFTTEHPVTLKRKFRTSNQVYLDLAFPALQFGIEVDGKYTIWGTPRNSGEDARRTELLQEVGWAVYRIPNSHLRRPEDADVKVPQILAHLAARKLEVDRAGGLQALTEEASRLFGEALDKLKK